jgi:signal transduction histidine kinase
MSLNDAAPLTRAPAARLRPKPGVGLTFRYLLHLVGVGAFLGILLIWSATSQQKRTVFEEMEQRGVLLGESLADACSLPYNFGDLKTVQYLLSRAKNFQDVVSIALLSKSGGLELHVSKSIPLIESLPKISESEDLTYWSDGEYIHVMAPVILERQESNSIAGMLGDESVGPDATMSQNTLGYIYLMLSLSRARTLVANLVLKSILATMAILLLGSGVTFVFFRRTVLRPIRQLIDAMIQVRRGNLKMSIHNPTASSEMSILNDTFNQMTQDLAGAEEKLVNANSDLEKRVFERTEALERANQELRESQERVVRSEKLAAIGQLASGVGHELRNPLGAIRNVVYYIRDSLKGSPLTENDPTMFELLDLADKEIKSATNIIGDLLDFSRVVRLAIQPTDINALIKDLKTVLEVPKTITIIEELAPNLPPATADPERLRQVFINLATNAIQAMGKDGSLKIRTRWSENAEDGKPWAYIAYQDSGPGISSENLKKIFEPLFSTKAKGTGLGLSICAGIVEAHGGKILVDSELGKGSTFTVKIPLGGPPK